MLFVRPTSLSVAARGGENNTEPERGRRARGAVRLYVPKRTTSPRREYSTGERATRTRFHVQLQCTTTGWDT